VTIAESPLWLRARLRDAGVRSISNVVDVTNYVMLALGNPLHAFDYEKLEGGSVVVRRAKEGEEMRTLDGNDRKLDTDDLLIADKKRAIALAGIMGGEETEVSERTTSVLLEAANFEPIGILRSSERLSLRTAGRRASTPISPGRRPRLRRSCSSSSRARGGRAPRTFRASCPHRRSSRCVRRARPRSSGWT